MRWRGRTVAHLLGLYVLLPVLEFRPLYHHQSASGIADTHQSKFSNELFRQKRWPIRDADREIERRRILPEFRCVAYKCGGKFLPGVNPRDFVSPTEDASAVCDNDTASAGVGDPSIGAIDGYVIYRKYPIIGNDKLIGERVSGIKSFANRQGNNRAHLICKT